MNAAYTGHTPVTAVITSVQRRVGSKNGGPAEQQAFLVANMGMAVDILIPAEEAFYRNSGILQGLNVIGQERYMAPLIGSTAIISIGSPVKRRKDGTLYCVGSRRHAMAQRSVESYFGPRRVAQVGDIVKGRVVSVSVDSMYLDVLGCEIVVHRGLLSGYVRNFAEQYTNDSDEMAAMTGKSNSLNVLITKVERDGEGRPQIEVDCRTPAAIDGLTALRYCKFQRGELLRVQLAGRRSRVQAVSASEEDYSLSESTRGYPDILYSGTIVRGDMKIPCRVRLVPTNIDPVCAQPGRLVNCRFEGYYNGRNDNDPEKGLPVVRFLNFGGGVVF